MGKYLFKVNYKSTRTFITRKDLQKPKTKFKTTIVTRVLSYFVADHYHELKIRLKNENKTKFGGKMFFISNILHIAPKNSSED